MSTNCAEPASLADAKTDLGKLREIVQGAAGDTVDTENGPLKTLAGHLDAILKLFDPLPFATTAAMNAALAGLDRGKFVVDEEAELLYVVADDGSGGNALKPLIDLSALDAATARRLALLEELAEKAVQSIYGSDGTLLLLHNGKLTLIDQPELSLPRFHGEVSGAKLMPLTASGVMPTAAIGDAIVAGVDAVTAQPVYPVKTDHPMYFTGQVFGREQVFAHVQTGDGGEDTIPLILAQEVEITLIDPLPDGSVRFRTTADNITKPRYGRAKAEPRIKSPQKRCIYFGIGAQSSGGGAASENNTAHISTVDPVMATRLFMLNRGTVPHQDVTKNGNTAALPPDRFAFLMPAQEGKAYDYDENDNIVEVPATRNTESMSCAYAATILSHYDEDTIGVVVNFSHGSSQFSEIYGDANGKAQPWLNFEAALQKGVDASTAPQPMEGYEWLHDYQVEADFICCPGFESWQSDPYHFVQPELLLLEQFADSLSLITGQARKPRIVGGQTPSARANPTDLTRKPETNYGARHLETFIRTEADRSRWALVTQDQQHRGLYIGNNYHPDSTEQYYLGCIHGLAAIDLEIGKRHRHLYIQKAELTGPQTVEGIFNRPARIRPTPRIVPGFGLEVESGNDETTHPIDRFELSGCGRYFKLSLASAPGASPILKTKTGIETSGPFVLGSSNFGNGVDHGLTSNIETAEPVGTILYTGKEHHLPLATMQHIPLN